MILSENTLAPEIVNNLHNYLKRMYSPILPHVRNRIGDDVGAEGGVESTRSLSKL